VTEQRGVPDLTCQELVELVTEYLEDALPQRDRDRFEEHLLACPPCQAHLAQVRETIRITGSVSAESLSPGAQRELLDAFRGWKRG
jgi:anti-sigma factor RsiW